MQGPSITDLLRQTLVLKGTTTESFPFLRTIYDFFSPRTRQITAWSFGFSYGNFEAEVLENTGCELTIFDARQESKDRFDIFRRVSEQHEVEDSDPEWAQDLLDHWFLVKKAHFNEKIPFRYSGSLLVNGTQTTLAEVDTKSNAQLDLLKIDYPTFECTLLQSILEAGYRPGLLWVTWTNHPDEDTVSMLSAGHLQTLGYMLLGSEGNTFLYKFMDSCLYESCSWNVPGVQNPMIDTILKSMSAPSPLSSSSSSPEPSAKATGGEPLSTIASETSSTSR